MIEAPKPDPRAKAEVGSDTAWDRVQRVFVDFESRSHQALDASRMRAGDVLRPAIEAVVAVPRAVAAVLRLSIDNSTKRVEDAADKAAATLTGAAAEMRKAAEVQRAAAAQEFKAQEAKAYAALTDRLTATTDAAVAADRRLRGWRAYGLAGFALLGVLGAGMLIEHWRAGYYRTAEVGASITSLQQQLNAATQNVATIKQAADGAGNALAILRTVGSLPPEEYAVAQSLLAELAKPPSARQSLTLSELKELMKLPADRRADAVRFALIDDANLRSNMTAITNQAAARNTPWFPNDRVFRGCLASGPNLPTTAKTTIRTCLVRLPDEWPSPPDDGLRGYYRSILVP